MELSNEFRVSVPVDEAWNVLTDVERIAPCMPGAELQEVQGDEYRGIVKVKVGPITAQYKGAARFVEKDDSAHRAVLKAEGRDTRGQGNANATIVATLQPDGKGTAVKVVTDLTVTGKVAQFGRGVLADVSTKLLSQFVDCLHDDLLASSASAPAPVAAPVAAAAPAVEAPLALPDLPEAPAAAEEPAWTPPAAEPAVAPAVAEVEPEPEVVEDEPAPEPAGPESEAVAVEPEPATAASNGQAKTAPAEPRASEPPPADEVRRIESRPAQPVDLLEAAGVPVAKRAIPVVAGILVILWFVRRRRRGR